MFHWDHLKILIAIAEAGTLSAASTLLRVTQPTVSRRLSELESSIGGKLFDRQKDGYHLTELGTKALEHAYEMQSEAKRLAEITSKQTAAEGKIIITANAGFSAYCLIPLLREFSALYPKVQYEIITTYKRLNVKRRAADIAIRLGEKPNNQRLECRLLGRTSFSLVASADYLKESGTPSSLTELRSHKVLGATGDLAGFMQNRLLIENSLGALNSLCSDSLLDHLSAARHGFGITTAANYLVYQDQNLVPVLQEQFSPQLDVWLIANNDYSLSKRIKLLVNFLEQHISALLKDVEASQGS